MSAARPSTPPHAAPRGRAAPPTWPALALALAALACFAPVRAFGFVALDDPDYVSENPFVRAGLTWEGIRWAFTTGHAGNWHPLTWLSHMLDVELLGLDPGAHHVVNALLHAAAVGLCYLVLARATGAPGRAAAVALLFGLHPLRVESIAWIAERKDVLSAALGLASTLAWLSWARERSRPGWALALAFLALGLMAKPMLVSLPFAWLLLDLWPLRRAGAAGPGLARLLLEKAPAFALVALSSLATWIVQREGGSMELAAATSFGERLGNALVAPLRYLGMILWPRGLTVLYPHPAMPGGTPLAPWLPWAAAAALLALTAAALTARRQPWLAVGWLWFLGMLVPVAGLVQVGGQSHADRYTYLPSIGIALALVWAGAELLERASAPRSLAAASVGALALACAVATRAQLPVWRDSRTLLEHALAHAPHAPLLWNNLGIELHRAGRLAEAAQAFERALAVDPRGARALYNFAVLRQSEGRDAEAEALYRRALESAPRHLPARVNLVGLLRASRRQGEAVRLAEEGLALGDDGGALRANLANALLDLGRLPQAEQHYRAGLALEPGSLPLRLGFGALLLTQGRRAEAEAQYRAALQLAPSHPEASEGLRRSREGR